MKRTEELLNSYGIRWEHNRQTAELKNLFETEEWYYAFQRGAENVLPEISTVMSWLLFHTGHLRIRETDVFLEKTQVKTIFEGRPLWLTENLAGFYNLKAGVPTMSWFPLLTQSSKRVREEQMKSGDPFFQKITNEYRLENLFNKEKANQILTLFLESELLETTVEMKKIYPETILAEEIFNSLKKDVSEWLEKLRN